MACTNCKKETPSLIYSTEGSLQNKRVLSWAAWFVSLSEPLQILRFNSDEHNILELPEDGFLGARTRFVDGTGENIGGNGWIVVMNTSAGLLFQATGDNNPPDPARYPNAKFIKDKLCPSALLHVVTEEMQQWR